MARASCGCEPPPSLYRADAGERSAEVLKDAVTAFPSDWAGLDITEARALLSI